MDALARIQLPAALLLLAFLAAHVALLLTRGEGLAPELVTVLAAGVAGALGVRRPSDAPREPTQ